ncbi:MAG: 50S ribosomal protein L11 methyltransferase [Pseudomonadales bacterium]|jgi:predicted nicotinamide N-methyase|nr:50S ribosomal protein L11 methyltransferase [Pseudomonadales bacterium]
MRSTTVPDDGRALAHTLGATLAALVPGARIEATRLPAAPALRLWLLGEDLPDGPLPHEVAEAVQAEPPYWSFCWASGQALARRILDAPELVRGRRVLDFGAGSGVAGIAAAVAGAERVLACDEDPRARLACEANAALNGVTLETVADLDAVPDVDLILIADVLYDRANLPLLDRLLALPADILLADSRVRPELLPAWRLVGQREAFTIPDLDESPLHRQVRFYVPQKPGSSRPSR